MVDERNAGVGPVQAPSKADAILRELVEAHAEWDALHWSKRTDPGAANRMLAARRKAREYVAACGVAGTPAFPGTLQSSTSYAGDSRPGGVNPSHCKTCKHWIAPTRDDYRAHSLCNPLDPENGFKPMQRGFEVRKCDQPTQTFAESPVERNGFGLVDASESYAVLVTAEDFGCVRHEPASPTPGL